MDRWFAAADADRDGRVSFDEFAAFLPTVSTNKARQQLRATLGVEVESELRSSPHPRHLSGHVVGFLACWPTARCLAAWLKGLIMHCRKHHLRLHDHLVQTFAIFPRETRSCPFDTHKEAVPRASSC